MFAILTSALSGQEADTSHGCDEVTSHFEEEVFISHHHTNSTSGKTLRVPIPFSVKPLTLMTIKTIDKEVRTDSDPNVHTSIEKTVVGSDVR